MANYNDGYIYNADGGQGGFFYNGASFLLLLRLHDTIRTIDDIGKQFALLVLNDKVDVAEQQLLLAALVGQSDTINFEDDMYYTTLFSMAEEFGIKDELIELVAKAYLYDNQKVLDDVRMVGNIISMDEDIAMGTSRSRAAFGASFHDESAVKAFLSIADRYGMHDEINYVMLLHKIFDSIGATDAEPNPKLSISDFLIGVFGDVDNAYEYLIPFGLKIDWNTTSLQIMPEAETTTVEMAGLDGSLWEHTIYKDRLFEIIAYSEQGLTISEKENLKTRITEILDSTKHQSKKLTVQSRGVSFDVKYTGLAQIQEAPSWIKATIPFMTQPYGYRSFEDELKGNGLISNAQGDAELGPIVEISGYVSNPSFSIGEFAYSWNGVVPQGYKLVIDFNMLTCYLVDPNLQKTNAMNKFNGTFHKIGKGKSEVLQIPSSISNHFNTFWQTRVLW